MKIFIIFLSFFISFGAKAANVDLLQSVYELVDKEYIKPNQLENMSINSLKALNKIDKKIIVADDGTRLSLYYKSQVYKSFLKPEKSTVKNWADISIKVIEAAKKASPKVAKQDFDVVDIILEAGIKKMDKDCSFYPDLSKRDYKYQHLPNFAVRQIDNILYVKLLSFNQYTLKELEDSLKDFSSEALILDLRGNRGGVLSSAIDVADLFVDGGMITMTKGRDGKATKIYNATEGDMLNMKPIFVLVDENSASSAELVALSLQEQGRAKIIGTQTFGKATVQDMLVLNEGRGLSLSTAEFYSPAGKSINKIGLSPDICTFDMLDTKNIANLLEETKTKKCLKEARITKDLEIGVVVYLLNQ